MQQFTTSSTGLDATEFKKKNAVKNKKQQKKATEY